MADEVLKTMIRQLQAQGVNLKRNKLVRVNDNSLNVVKLKPRQKISDEFEVVNLTYNKGDDLYDVVVSKLKKGAKKPVRTLHKGMYWDQLGGLF